MTLRDVRVVVLALACAAVQARSASAQGPLRKIGELDLSILGISATLQNTSPAVPRNTASGLRITIAAGAGEINPADLTVELDNSKRSAV